MASYFDQTIQTIQHQRWHGQCSEQSLAAFQSVGYHSCLLRVDGKQVEAAKLCALRNLRSVDERLSQEELNQWEGVHPHGVLHVGRTPVMTAIWVNSLDGLHVLRTAGASFTMRCPQDDDFTALHYAVKLRRVDMIRYILPLLPRPQLLAKTKTEGDTPLLLAARCGHYDVVGILLAHAAKLHSEDTFVWKQLNQEGGDPPPSALVCQMLLSRGRRDGCSPAHLIAQCRIATDDGPVSGGDVSSTGDVLFDTPTPLAALKCLLECADAHDALIPLLSSPALQTSSGEHLLTSCESPVLWQLVKTYCGKCGFAVSWEAPNASGAAAQSPSGGMQRRRSTLKDSKSFVAEDDSDDEAVQAGLLRLRSRRLLSATGEELNGDAPVLALPLLTSGGDTPLHRLAEKANLRGGDGMVRLWLHCLVEVFPPSPHASPTSVDPQWRHHVRDDAYTKVLEFASPRTGKSAWSTVIELHGADNETAQDMMNVALELDAEHEAVSRRSASSSEPADMLFTAAGVAAPRDLAGTPDLAASDASETPFDATRTVSPQHGAPIRPQPPATPIQTLQCYKLLTVFDNDRNSRRLTHHLSYHASPSGGLQWLRDHVISRLCSTVRSSADAIMSAMHDGVAAAIKASDGNGRPISASSGIPSGLPGTPLLPKSQRSVSPPNGTGKDDQPPPQAQALSPLADRPRSRGGPQFVDEANNASFRSTGSNETNQSANQSRATTVGGTTEMEVALEYEKALTAQSGLLYQLSALYRDVLLAVDQDGFAPLFIAALRDNGDAVNILCEISDRIAAEAMRVVQFMAQITAQTTKSRRAAAEAAQAAADAAAAAKAMRRSNSNLKRTPSMSTNHSNSATAPGASTNLQRVSSSSAMPAGVLESEAFAASQSGLAHSASFAFGGATASAPPSMMVKDVREALQHPDTLIPQEFEAILEVVMSELDASYAHAIQKEQAQFAAQQLVAQQQAAVLEASVSEVVTAPPPASPPLTRAGGAGGGSSTGAPTPVEDPAVATQKRRSAAIETLEWDALMGSSGDQGILSVAAGLNGAEVVQTVDVLFRSHHPIRTKTSALHQAAEAGGSASSRALVTALLTRWSSETERTVRRRRRHDNEQVPTLEFPRPTLERSKTTLIRCLSQTGSDTNQHRSVLHIAVRRGDFRTVHSVVGVLGDALAAAQDAREAALDVVNIPTALSVPSLVTVINVMSESWGGGSSSFTTCASLSTEAMKHCHLLNPPNSSPTRKRLVFRNTAGTPVRAEPLTRMESSLYLPPAADDDDDDGPEVADSAGSTCCCDGNGQPAVDGASYYHKHSAVVRCRCWLMMSDIHHLLTLSQRASSL